MKNEGHRLKELKQTIEEATAAPDHGPQRAKITGRVVHPEKDGLKPQKKKLKPGKDIEQGPQRLAA